MTGPTPANKLPRVTIKRLGKALHLEKMLGPFPEKTPITTSDMAESWLRDRLILLVPGPDGMRLNEGFIHVPLSAAIAAREALLALVLDGLVEVSLLTGAVRVGGNLERLRELVCWARRIDMMPRRLKKERDARAAALATRPEPEDDRGPMAEQVTRWLTPVPERSAQVDLFRGGRG